MPFWIALTPRVAHALNLRWDAPPGCADAGRVSERIIQTLGPRAADPAIAVDAQVTSDGAEWVLMVRLTSPELTDLRTLRAASCEPLLEGVAVIVAALLPPVSPVPPAAPVPLETSEVEHEPAPAHLGLAGSVSLVGEHGALPALSGGLALGAQLVVSSFRFGLAGQGFLPRTVQDGGLAGADTQVGLWAALFSVCFDVPWKRAVISPGLTLEGGQLFARERRLKGAGSGTAPWIAPGAVVALRLELSESWTLGPEIQALFPLRRAQVDVGPRGAEVRVHENRAVSLRAGLTLGFRFWGDR